MPYLLSAKLGIGRRRGRAETPDRSLHKRVSRASESERAREREKCLKALPFLSFSRKRLEFPMTGERKSLELDDLIIVLRDLQTAFFTAALFLSLSFSFAPPSVRSRSRQITVSVVKHDRERGTIDGRRAAELYVRARPRTFWPHRSYTATLFLSLSLFLSLRREDRWLAAF